MKEIKVKILGQIGYSYDIKKIEVVPLERLSGPLNAGKTYKLVEDEPDGFVTASFKTNPLVNVSINEKKEFAKYLEHAPKMIFSTSIPYSVFGTRSGGKTVSQMRFDEYKPKKRVQFNGNATILEIGDFKTVVKCDEGDEFNEVIGLGLALSRYYKKQPYTKKEIVLLEKMLKYNMVAEYCFQKYFKFDDKRINKCVDDIFDTRNKWVEL